MLGVIVQARMNSERLPGKVMLEVNGLPIIDYLFSQLKYIDALDKTILATTTNKGDNPLVDYAKSNKINFYRGSEKNVLKRFYQTAKHYNLQHIMRVTGDCPLLDPNICKALIDKHFFECADYTSLGASFAEGSDCELMSFNSLEVAHYNAKLKSEREHVTLYFINHEKDFVNKVVENDFDDSRYRFTLDEECDFQVIKAIIENLSLHHSPPYTSEMIKQFFVQHPEVFELNKNIVRNEGLINSLIDDEIIETH